ncbi:asparagine synthase (glutamine-hydrolyzing) [Thauera sp. Sel9]|uniref:asparagine synthase (glutamine-hydrolyzing) n=1 Tax=Thauera sp. Sel9 TaxID=2974299 RepID=UPI0021E12CE3|nr:asparagine synthase (glutamine-hydrolyzing) [Thauera sp. Sel9]MCV2218230.1 asparagine synthase (glutamine-hydrolyzing) [Thauera sp. Sel9]
MCGIAGLLSAVPCDLRPIFSMTSVQAHRGPDGAGHALFSDQGAPQSHGEHPGASDLPAGRLALGHRRLSIIDCTDRAHQPMSYADGRYWITYNGEVYNYRELREELRSRGCTFRSESDTEVVLAAYSQWGADCFARFNGMWALAIWDAVEQKLILSRDRFGVKPLHFRVQNNTLWFSSEIKGVLAGATAPTQANDRVVHDYLVFGTINASNETFFDGIAAFPPGCHATVSAQNLVPSPKPYWHLELGLGEGKVPSFEEACDTFRELITSAVKLRMRSDVPVGACLSGGLDSSSIVSLMARIASSSVHTFTARFSEPEFDESLWAQRVIDATGVVGHMAEPTESALIDDFAQLVWHQEEPFSTASLYAQWAVMREARRNSIPVLLDGQGADEILGGYRKFYAFHVLSLLRQKRFIHASREALAVLLNGDRGYWRWHEGIRYLPAFLRPDGFKVEDFLRPSSRALSAASTVALGATSDIRERQMLDLNHYSVPSLLRYEDRNSMAWSVESRVPFLDYRLVEFAVRLPIGHKLRAGRTKAVLRHGLRGIVPDQILDRRDKMGFVTPQSQWMNGSLGKHMEDACLDAAQILGRWVDVQALLRAWRTMPPAERQTAQAVVFRIGTLARWLNRFNISAP